jgi:hypothetical protein
VVLLTLWSTNGGGDDSFVFGNNVLLVPEDGPATAFILSVVSLWVTAWSLEFILLWGWSQQNECFDRPCAPFCPKMGGGKPLTD